MLWDRAPNGEINVDRKTDYCFPFPALCGQDLRFVVTINQEQQQELSTRENGKAHPHRVTWGCGVGDPASPGVTVCSKQTAARTRRRRGLPRFNANRLQGSPGTMATFFLQVGNGKPGILTWPSTVGGEDTERRVAPGPQWEDLGPPPQEASFT